MSKRQAVLLSLVIILTAGCSATGESADERGSNATLSLPGYEQADSGSSVEERVFWDRSKSWEHPGNRTVTVVSHAAAYSNASGTDTAVVYTTLNKPYIGSDRVRSLPAPALAALATRSVETRPLGTTIESSYRSSLLGEEVTVQVVTGGVNGTTAHVTHGTRDSAVVAVVVVGDVGRTTVERVLDSITLRESAARDE